MDPDNKNVGIKLLFPPGEKFGTTMEYKLTYNLYCDLTEEIRLKTVKKIATCVYEYHFLTKHACYSNFIKESSLSSKTILFYLISIFSLY